MENRVKCNNLKSKCSRFTAPQEAQAKGIYPYYKPIESEQGTVVKINGKDALIRFALMATHTFEQVDEAIDKITKAFQQAKIIDS